MFLVINGKAISFRNYEKNKKNEEYGKITKTKRKQGYKYNFFLAQKRVKNRNILIKTDLHRNCKTNKSFAEV